MKKIAIDENKTNLINKQELFKRDSEYRQSVIVGFILSVQGIAKQMNISIQMRNIKQIKNNVKMEK